MSYSTLYYKLDFVLDDFAQLCANVSVLSMCKVGQAKLRCSLGVIKAFLTWYFQVMMGLLGGKTTFIYFFFKDFFDVDHF